MILVAKQQETIAAKRRRLQGKRRGEDFNTTQFSLDMEEHLLMEAWDSFTNDDWTRPLRLQAETEKTNQEKANQEKEKKVKKNTCFFKKNMIK